MIELRAEELRPEHLGSRIEVPVGLERRELYLARLSFRRYENSLRVVVDSGVGGDYYDLAAYAKVRILAEPQDRKVPT